MREELITFSALIELELDFSQEDVEFADRHELYMLLERIDTSTRKLIDSFRTGFTDTAAALKQCSRRCCWTPLPVWQHEVVRL